MAHHRTPGSKSERDALRHEMLTTGCTRSDIAAEMRARFAFRPREAWRHAHGWSLQQAADRINTLGAARPDAVAADASLLGKWEKWPLTAGRKPSNAVLGLMAAAYECVVPELLDFEDRRMMPSATVAHGPSSPQPSAPPRPEPSDRAEPELPTGAVAVRCAAEESAAWAQWAENTNVGEIALEQIYADVRALAADYLVGDAVETFIRARGLRDKIFRLLEGHQPPRQAADLYVCAGYVCGLMAWMSSDLGHLAAADTHGRTAMLCGETVGHNGLRAWTASTRSKIAFWDGRYRDAINHARRGASYTAPGTADALLACQEADAWSRLGATDETRAALRRAEAARDSITGEDEIGGLLSCSIGRQEQYAAAALLRIGSYSEALTEADSALGHLQEQQLRVYGTEAQTRISQAMAYVGLSEPEAVMDTLEPVLGLPPERRLDTVIGRMRDLGTMMAGGPGARSAASIKARADLTDWCQDSAPRRLALSPGADSA